MIIVGPFSSDEASKGEQSARVPGKKFDHPKPKSVQSVAFLPTSTMASAGISERMSREDWKKKQELDELVRKFQENRQNIRDSRLEGKRMIGVGKTIGTAMKHACCAIHAPKRLSCPQKSYFCCFLASNCVVPNLHG